MTSRSQNSWPLISNIEFIHSDDSPGSSVDALFCDWRQASALQDFRRELIIHTEVCSSQLPASALYQLFLLEVLKLCNNGSRAMDLVEGDVLQCVLWVLKLFLKELLDEPFRIFLCLLLNLKEDQVFPYTGHLNFENGLLHPLFS